MVGISYEMNSVVLQVDSTRNSLRTNLLNLSLFGFGAFINAASYLSFAPVLLAVLFFGFFYIVLYLTPLGGVWERRIFTRVFLVGFFMAGVAAVYANQFQDQSQLYSDAGGFYEMAAISPLRYLPLIELERIHEGALAIKIWASVYDFFSFLGFQRDRYVGILVNVCAVALTGVVTLKMARLMYFFDTSRFKRLTLLFSLCGLFWLFAGIHLRDSVVLLAVTALAHTWLYFLHKPDLSYRLIVVTVSSLLAGAFFGFLRGEFIIVPIATAIAATAALMFGVQSRRRFISYFLVIIGLGLSGWLLLNFSDAIQYTLSRGNQSYAEHAAEQHSVDSLGMALIVNQPMPVRVLLGSIYLFLFPIPFWKGFQLESAYNIFKSFNVLLFYFLIPLFVLSLHKIWEDKSIRSPKLLFLLLFSLGFTVAIAGTSMETRHFGVFLPPMFLLALLPDFSIRAVRVNYKRLLMLTFAGVVLVHLTWIAIKL